MDLRKLDLNLLTVFEALMLEGSVTRAARRMNLSQPALSEALARLRRSFDDEMFVRGPKGMRPTQRALALGGPIDAALGHIRAALREREAFDPSAGRRTFRIGAGDYGEAILLPGLIRRLRVEAPQIDLRIVATTPRSAPDLLDREEIDLAIEVFPDALSKRFKRMPLLKEHVVCLARRGHPGIGRTLDLATYLATPHVVRALDGEPGKGLVDRVLAARGMERRIALTVTNVLALPFAIDNSDFIATQPARIARLLVQMGNLVIHRPPLAFGNWTIDLLTGRRPERDASLGWLVRTIREVCKQID